jgi:hypothetical protein
VLDVQDRQNCIKITESALDNAKFASTLIMDYSGYNGRVVFSLDTEWCCDTHQNPNGQVTWSGLPELMQIGYYHDGIRAKAWLIPLTKISKKIPSTLLTFLTDARFEFCGIQVSNERCQTA